MTFENFEKTLDGFIEEGLLKGKKVGILEEKEATALEMLRDGMTLDKISKYTKLSSEKIHALKKRL